MRAPGTAWQRRGGGRAVLVLGHPTVGVYLGLPNVRHGCGASWPGHRRCPSAAITAAGDAWMRHTGRPLAAQWVEVGHKAGVRGEGGGAQLCGAGCGRRRGTRGRSLIGRSSSRTRTMAATASCRPSSSTSPCASPTQAGKSVPFRGRSSCGPHANVCGDQLPPNTCATTHSHRRQQAHVGYRGWLAYWQGVLLRCMHARRCTH